MSRASLKSLYDSYAKLEALPEDQASQLQNLQTNFNNAKAKLEAELREGEKKTNAEISNMQSTYKNLRTKAQNIGVNVNKSGTPIASSAQVVQGSIKALEDLLDQARSLQDKLGRLDREKLDLINKIKSEQLSAHARLMLIIRFVIAIVLTLISLGYMTLYGSSGGIGVVIAALIIFFGGSPLMMAKARKDERLLVRGKARAGYVLVHFGILNFIAFFLHAALGPNLLGEMGIYGTNGIDILLLLNAVITVGIGVILQRR